MEGSKPVYRPWVGVLLSFLISGAGQFLAGRKFRGVLWWGGFFLLWLATSLIAASPGLPSLVPALLVAALVLAGWLVMLRDAYRPVPKMGLWRWVAVLFLFAAVRWVELTCMAEVVRTFYVSTASMEPTIQGGRGDNRAQAKGGDHVLVQRFAYWFHKPQRGDLVVFRTDGLAGLPSNQFFVRRVVGLPGDRISFPNGQLHIDGRRVTEPQVFKEIRYNDPPQVELKVLSSKHGSVVIPPGQYFLVGDNATRARDSREHGPVPVESIIGRLTKIYWPPSRAGIPRFVPPPAAEANPQ